MAGSIERISIMWDKVKRFGRELLESSAMMNPYYLMVLPPVEDEESEESLA